MANSCTYFIMPTPYAVGLALISLCFIFVFMTERERDRVVITIQCVRSEIYMRSGMPTLRIEILLRMVRYQKFTQKQCEVRPIKAGNKNSVEGS